MKVITLSSKDISESEVSQVATIHYEFLNTSFLSQLGPKFLFYLYDSIYNCEETELIIAKDKDHVVGFITGASSLRPVYKYMLKKHLLKIIFSLLPTLLSITKIKKILEVLNHSKHEDTAGSKVSPRAELLSIAVKSDYRGNGVAQSLFKELSSQFKKKGIASFKIIVGDRLIAAKNFYMKMGATEIGEITIHQGEQSTIFKVNC